MGSNPEIVTPPTASVDRADMEMSEEEADSALEQALAITQPASPQASATLSGQAQVRATVTPQGAPLASTATAQPGAGEGSSEAPGEAAAETDLDNLLRTSPVVTERAAASPGRGSGYQSEPGFGTQLSQFNPQGAMAPAGANIGAGLGLTLAASRGGATEKPAFRETLLSAISPAASGARAHQPGLVQYQATDGRLQTALPAAVGQPQWGKALGERVMWLASQNIKEADIRLDPPELGQLQVRVSVNQEQASVTFTSPHANVREALDQNAFRLRELFQDGGIDLVNVDVSDQSQSGDSDTESDESGSPSLAGTESEEDAVASTDILGTGLVDHYV